MNEKVARTTLSRNKISFFLIISTLKDLSIGDGNWHLKLFLNPFFQENVDFLLSLIHSLGKCNFGATIAENVILIEYLLGTSLIAEFQFYFEIRHKGIPKICICTFLSFQGHLKVNFSIQINWP